MPMKTLPLLNPGPSRRAKRKIGFGELATYRGYLIFREPTNKTGSKYRWVAYHEDRYGQPGAMYTHASSAAKLRAELDADAAGSLRIVHANPSKLTRVQQAVRSIDSARTKAKYGSKDHIPGLRYKAEGIDASGHKVVSRTHTLSAANTSKAAKKAVKGAVVDTATGRVMTVLKPKRQHSRTKAPKTFLVPKKTTGSKRKSRKR